MELDPLRLLAAANQGDREAYRRLLEWLRQHCQGQLSAGLRRYKNFPREALEDITQDVLLTFHTSHQTFDATKPFRPWIDAIIRHKLIDFIRRKDFVVMMSATDVELIKATWPHPDSGHDERPDLQPLIDQLHPQQSQVLKLAKLEGQSGREIARALKLSESNVKVLLHRALKKLKALAAEEKKRN